MDLLLALIEMTATDSIPSTLMRIWYSKTHFQALTLAPFILSIDFELKLFFSPCIWKSAPPKFCNQQMKQNRYANVIFSV